MFELIRPGTRIDFVGKRFVWLGLSVVFILATLVLFFTKGLNYGIDFTGGAEVHVRVPAQWDTGHLREVLKADHLEADKLIQVGGENSGEFLIRMQGDEKTINASAKSVETTLSKTLKAGEFEMKSVGVVGPAAGANLRKSGFLSMFYALAAILIYVAFRFDSKFAPGAVLALFHDTMIVVGIFILTQKQFDLVVLAALLALIGYSNNDTIIVFDRVRETLQLHTHLTIDEAVNRSINETLGRTLLTSVMTFITAFCLWAFGGGAIENFAFTFMIGIVVGTYSSIFIASSLVIFLFHRAQAKTLEAKGAVGGKPARA